MTAAGDCGPPPDGQDDVAAVGAIAGPAPTQDPTLLAGAVAVESRGASEPGWRTLLVFARADLPLVLGHDQGVDNIISTFDFVPGSTLRGAIATDLLGSGWRETDDRFRDIFVREGVEFGPLYPTGPGWSLGRTTSLPCPLSFQTCKDYPGVISYQRRWAHGMRDLLHPAAPRQCGKPRGGGQPACQAPLTPLGGYLYLERNPPGDLRQWQHLVPRLAAVLRSATARATRRGADRQLFATESIPRGSLLAGYIWGPGWAVTELRNAWAGDDARTLHVGKCQSRGHGRLRVWLRVPGETSDPVYPFLYPEPDPVARGVQPGGGVPPAGFTITCYSDLISLDGALRPIGRLDEQALWWLLGGRGEPPFRLESGFARTRQVSGFNGKPGVPRTVDLALAAGSTWRFAWQDSASESLSRKGERGASAPCPDAGRQGADAPRSPGSTPSGTDSEERRKDAQRRLEAAHSRGLGLRRGEGFGRILLDLPWHSARIDQLAQPAGASGTSADLDWVADVPAPPDRAIVGFEAQTSRERRPVRAARPSPVRERRPELRSEPIARVLADMRPPAVPVAAIQAAARWLYQASVAADPWRSLEDEADSRFGRLGKPGRDHFVGLLKAVQGEMAGRPRDREGRLSLRVVADIREILRDLSEALARRALKQATSETSPSSNEDEEADDAGD